MALGALRARRRTEDGAAALEFALVVPFLILLLVGMISTGQVYSDYLGAQNAVREGARYGASADISSSSWATSVRDRVKDVYFNGTGATDAQICVKLVKPDGTAVTGVSSAAGADCGTEPATPSNMATGNCAVKVWITRPEKIQLVIFPDATFDITAQSVAYYGRKVGTSCTAS